MKSKNKQKTKTNLTNRNQAHGDGERFLVARGGVGRGSRWVKWVKGVKKYNFPALK